MFVLMQIQGLYTYKNPQGGREYLEPSGLHYVMVVRVEACYIGSY